MPAADESFHQTFLKTMFAGIKLGALSNKLSCRERKRAIKLSANIAMAVAGKGSNWRRALIAQHAIRDRNRVLVRTLVGKKRFEAMLTQPCCTSRFQVRRMMMRNTGRRTPGNATSARVVAMSMVKKRTRVLKKLVPGGERLDDLTLLGETIDYVSSLQAQVNILRLITEVFSVSNLSSHTKGGI